jgi:hypothetical protein
LAVFLRETHSPPAEGGWYKGALNGRRFPHASWDSSVLLASAVEVGDFKQTTTAHRARGTCIACMTLFAFLLEPPVRLFLRNGSPGLCQPACADIGLSIEFRDIGLDIQERRAVQDVHVLDVEHRAFNSMQADNGEPYGVGSLGGTGSEKSPFLNIQEGYNVKTEALAAMKMVQQDDVREAVKILQTRAKLLKHLYGTHHAGRSGRLYRHTLNLGERGVDDSNWRELYFHLSCERSGWYRDLGEAEFRIQSVRLSRFRQVWRFNQVARLPGLFCFESTSWTHLSFSN